MNCGIKKLFSRKIIAVIYAKRKPKKNSGWYGIRIRLQERAREPLGRFFTLNKPVPRLIRMLVSNWAQKLFLCSVNRRPESIALLYLQCKLDCSPYRVPGSSKKTFFEKSFQVKMGPKKAKEIQQFCSMLAKQNKTKNAPAEVIRLWTDRKDIRKHQSTSRLGHYNSASLLYQFRSILMCHEGELMFNNKIKLT